MLIVLWVMIAVILSYALGSICSAVIVCRLCHLPDPRLQGSRNPGTTNVLRLAGKKFALIVLLADFLKGLVPVLGFKLLGVAPGFLGYIGFAAVVGHIYPVFFQFKGGKGVATALGVLFGLDWRLGLAAVLTWLVVAFLTRYSSLAAMIALVLAPLYAMFLMPQALLPLMLMSACVLYQHRENMQRLMQGQESKIKL